jgi:Flp pilus assembly protein TadG
METRTPRTAKKLSAVLQFMGFRNGSDAGQSLMEFALLLPFLTLLMVGVVETGRAAYFSLVVTNAAAAGAEWGSQSLTNAMNVTGMQTAATTDASYSSMTATATYGCACDSGTGTSCSYPVPAPSTCDASVSCSGQVVQCVQVTTHASFAPLFHYPGLPSSYQSNGRAVMRVRE